MAKSIKTDWLTDYLRSNPLQVTLQVIGVGVLILNLFLASKLAPLVQDISVIKLQVHAMEEKLDRASSPVEITDIKAAVGEVKDSVIRLETKVDRLIERMIPYERR